MSFAAKFANQSEKTGSMLDAVIKENALVYALWMNGEEAVRHFLIIHVEKAKHSRFSELLEKKERINFQEFGEILYFAKKEPNDEEKTTFRQKYGLFTENE